MPGIQTVEGLLLSLMVDNFGLAALSEVLNYWKQCVWPVLWSTCPFLRLELGGI